MGYAKEFNHLEYQVPEFLLKDSDWEDVSWHNDVCPRWENKKIGLAVWVDCNEPECREYEDWKQYTVVEIEGQSDGTTVLKDDSLFSTEVQAHLEEWITLYETKMHIESAFTCAGKTMSEEGHDIADQLALLLAETQEVMNEL